MVLAAFACRQPAQFSIDIAGTIEHMNDSFRGIVGFGLNAGSEEPPTGHTKLCWAGAVGLARRGRGWEDFAVSHERARELLATDPSACGCTAQNKGTRGRRQR